jgi:hypothetical protein
MQTPFLEKRSFERITTRLRVEFDCNNTICCSAVINLSENGMLLRTAEILFPMDTNFEIFIHLEEEVLILPVNVSRLVKTGNIYDSIGIELINPPKKYFDYVDSLRSSTSYRGSTSI